MSPIVRKQKPHCGEEVSSSLRPVPVLRDPSLRACSEVVTKLFSVTVKEESTIDPTELTLRIFANCRAVLSGVEERLRQFGCPKHIRDAL